MDTRIVELKREQETTHVMVGGLIDRMEAITLQIKKMQEQAIEKWD